MELFVTVGVCKVIFCMLMILYTQYCPMSVFIFVSSLPVPFCFRSFHLQTSEMVLFVTITMFIANVSFYRAMALRVQFHPMNFLFFCVRSLLAPSHFSWFQVVPVRFMWLQVVSARSLLYVCT